MTPHWLLNAMQQLCTIYDRVPAGVDEYGNATYDTVAIANAYCLLQPVSESDIQLGRAAVGTFMLFLPAEAVAVVSPFSTFELDGLRYEADGPAAAHRELFSTAVHHIEVNVSRSSA